MVTSREAPWGYRQPTPSLSCEKARSQFRDWMAVGRRANRSLGRPKVQSVPPERGLAGGRGGTNAFAESPSGLGASSSSACAPATRDDSSMETSLLFFSGCVAQMVERSLRMRQVLGSMPSASIRGGRTRKVSHRDVVADCWRQGTAISQESPALPESTLVAGSLRSFPQDSRRLNQFYQVKRMIRGSGSSKLFTYSQTLNR
jgi:hypothetical protein